jgi:two-component system cell cycle response regulator DivK
MNGIEICKELKKIEKFKKIPFLAVTSFAMKGDKERIMAGGFNQNISKPIKVQEFRELVTKLLQ